MKIAALKKICEIATPIKKMLLEDLMKRSTEKVRREKIYSDLDNIYGNINQKNLFFTLILLLTIIITNGIAMAQRIQFFGVPIFLIKKFVTQKTLKAEENKENH